MENRVVDQPSKVDVKNPQSAVKKILQTNPFTTYRDPKTGQWLVVKADSSR